MRTFELKPEHIKLLRNANVTWEDCEYGAPSIDCKRPYGNSYAEGDITEILGVELFVVDNYGGGYLSQEQVDYCRDIHRETETALQIILATGQFEPGKYVADNYTDNWRRAGVE